MRFREFGLFEQAAEKLSIPDSKGNQTVIKGLERGQHVEVLLRAVNAVRFRFRFEARSACPLGGGLLLLGLLCLTCAA